MKNPILLILLFIAGLGACKKDNTEESIINDLEQANQLRQNSDTLSIDNKTIFLTTYVSRDFMPVAEENGSPLAGTNSITELDSIALTNAFVLKKQYIIYGDEIWTKEYSDIQNEPKHILTGTTFGGPKWGPNVLVDIVCEFEYNGERLQIIAKSQKIKATY
jgi:hypothetical protein